MSMMTRIDGRCQIVADNLLWLIPPGLSTTSNLG